MLRSNDVIETRNIYIGAPDAPVTITAYIDYESTVCATLNNVLQELLVVYNGRLRLNFRHFPMAGKHQKAMKAAEAAVAAAQENLFWPMHNLLFKNRKNLGTISLKQYAKEAGIQNKRFLDQLVNGTFAWQVREDLLEAVDNGITYAGTVLINGQKLEHEFTVEAMRATIDDFLSHASL